MDDDVIVLKAKDNDNNNFVVAHVDGVKPCGELIMFTVFANPVDMAGSDSAVMVWDVLAKKVYTMPQPDGPVPVTFPCSIKDPIFVEWFAKRTNVGEDLLLTKHYQGNDEWGYMGTGHQELTPGHTGGNLDLDWLYAVWYAYADSGRPERVVVTNWYPESGMTDRGNDEWRIGSNGWDFYFVINAYAPGPDSAYPHPEDGPNGPWSFYCSTVGPVPAYLRTEVTYEQHYTFSEALTKREVKNRERWFTPFGLLGDSPEGELTREYPGFAFSYYMTTTVTGIPHHLQHFNNSLPPEGVNFYAAKWEQGIHLGCISEKTIVYVAGVLYGCPVHTYKGGNDPGGASPFTDETFEYPTDRVMLTHVVVVSVPSDEDARDYDYSTATSNPALEAELVNLVNKACDLNLMPRQLMPYSMDMDTKILKK